MPKRPVSPWIFWPLWSLGLLPMIVLGMADADHRFAAWMRRLATRRALKIAAWEISRGR
jgi:hypothetical protein